MPSLAPPFLDLESAVPFPSRGALVEVFSTEALCAVDVPKASGRGVAPVSSDIVMDLQGERRDVD